MKLSLIRDAVRAKEIVGILLRYRFDEFLSRLETPAAWLTRLTPAIKEGTPLYKRVRLALEDLGPTFIKIGQILSTRPDILQGELIEELEQLRENVRPVPFETVRVCVEKELGGPIENTFSVFEEAPRAAGSLGQLHRARMASTGQWVAVKVQRPSIRKPIQTDLEILTWFAQQFHQNFPEWRGFDLPSVMEELRQGLLNELDFAIEARNAAVFNSLNQFPDTVFAPEVIAELTTSRLLVTEWIDGQSPSKVQLDPAIAKRIAHSGGNSFFSQIVITGFFHGDPHPGNLLITPDHRICFVDWGIAGQLTTRMRHSLIDLFAACAQRDAEAVTRIALRLGRNSTRIHRIELEKAITTTLFKHETSLKRMEQIGKVIFELIFVFGSHGISVARDYTLLAKAVISIERTSTLLSPDFNLAAIGKPFVREANWQRNNPRRMLRSLFGEWQERLAKIAEIPEDTQRLLHRIEDESLPIHLQHRGIQQVGDTVHHAFSRLSLAVIIAALLISSSLVITTGVKPFLWGYPAIGIIGYLLSAAIGAYVAFDILRSSFHSRD